MTNNMPGNSLKVISANFQQKLKPEGNGPTYLKRWKGENLNNTAQETAEADMRIQLYS